VAVAVAVVEGEEADGEEAVEALAGTAAAAAAGVFSRPLVPVQLSHTRCGFVAWM
jgi:hypothetical protein